MKRSKASAPKPLLEIRKPFKARVYRSKFKALDTTKYLDVAALKRAAKVTIEIGSLEIAGLSQPIAAEIRKGMVVALKPIGCKGCNEKRSAPKSKMVSTGDIKKAAKAVGAAMKDRGIASPPMPVPVKVSSRLGFEIPFGPIIIVIGDPGDGGFDCCVQIWIGNKLCWWCVRSPNGCIGFGPPT